jgi:D-arabinose 1-dehydrogenase-like Zn-dependent alcohol dehydrogenase
LFRNALGAEVTAFSRQEDKLADAKKLGYVHAVGDRFAKPYALECDIIISTADVTEKFPLEPYIKYVSHCLSCSSPPLSSRRLPYRACLFVLVDRR